MEQWSLAVPGCVLEDGLGSLSGEGYACLVATLGVEA